MKRWAMLVATAGLLSSGLSTQCPFFPGPPPGESVTIELVNNGDDSVDVDVYISDNPDISRADLLQTGEQVQETVDRNQVIQIVRTCDWAQAVTVSAVLDVPAGAGPAEDSVVVRQGSNFQCGGVVTFTFDHNTPQTDLTISVSVR